MQKAASNQQTEYKNWFYIVSLTRSWFEPRCVMELLQCWGWLGHHPQFRSHFSLAMCHMCSCIGDCSGVIPLASSYLHLWTIVVLFLFLCLKYGNTVARHTIWMHWDMALEGETHSKGMCPLLFCTCPVASAAVFVCVCVVPRRSETNSIMLYPFMAQWLLPWFVLRLFIL